MQTHCPPTTAGLNRYQRQQCECQCSLSKASARPVLKHAGNLHVVDHGIAAAMQVSDTNVNSLMPGQVLCTCSAHANNAYEMQPCVRWSTISTCHHLSPLDSVPSVFSMLWQRPCIGNRHTSQDSVQALTTPQLSTHHSSQHQPVHHTLLSLQVQAFTTPDTGAVPPSHAHMHRKGVPAGQCQLQQVCQRVP